MCSGGILKKKIDISGVDSLSFLGMRDQNIKIIQEKVKAQIVVRGSAMQVDGEKDDIKLVESVVNEMMLIRTIEPLFSFPKNCVMYNVLIVVGIMQSEIIGIRSKDSVNSGK